MTRGIYAALSGALAQQVSLESVATNLANASTLGYRSVVPAFQEVLKGNGGGRNTVHFAAVRRSGIDTSAAPREDTERPLDAALGKDTFLAVQTPGGERYTRALSLELAADGTLKTKSGFAVLTEGGTPLKVEPGTTLALGPDGQVLDANGGSVARLRLVSFPNPGNMSYEGSYLLAAGPAVGAPQPSDEPLTVGSLELSNASPVRAMTDLMLATRMSEAMDRAIGTFRDADQRLASTVPK